MKNIILLTLFALVTLSTEAQVITFNEKSKVGAFADFRVGTRFGGAVNDNIILSPGFNVQGGLGYMVSKYWGFKGDLGFSTFNSKKALTPSFGGSSAARISLQAILSISEVANFNIKNFGLNLHAGFGIATIKAKEWKKLNPNAQDPFIRGNDDVINLRVGLNPKYHISNAFSLDLDFSFNMLAKQDHTIDRSAEISEGMTNYSTLSIGLTCWFSELSMRGFPSRFNKIQLK